MKAITVQITEGYGGTAVVAESCVPSFMTACDWLNLAIEEKHFKNHSCWIFQPISPEQTIVDFGNHTYFAKIIEKEVK